MKKIAVLILTYNEEHNIVECIKSADFADEIIVIDSGSTDHTQEIVENLGVIFYHHVMTGFADQRNFALLQTQADFVFYLDADERLTAAAGLEIRALIEVGDYAYQIKRINIVFGQSMKYGAQSPDYSLRLYPRNAIHWNGKVHESAVVGLPIKKMKNVMYHYTYTDWNKYFIKFNQYTTLMADRMHDDGKKTHLSDLTIRPWFAFFRVYILKLGFLDGKMGFIFAMLHGYYTFAKYVKCKYIKS